ncbi:hypothetical protein [Halococcus sp. IIIV-5B]|uniref:hypothetical protein n=1 Tax=Halococcus sp. IIIV-5B TaxID=2321230 RepID=UPI0011C4A51C|nr:hypothetical protein [Halococcus sp. IIIV-5B]
MSADQSDLAAYGGNEATPDGACIRYEQCENIVPENGRICGPCLDELRAADRERREKTSRI